MGLMRMDVLLQKARQQKYALGAFECWDSASARGIAEAARECRMPVIFQASPVEYNLAGGAATFRKMVQLYIEANGIDAAIHLDHGATLDQVKECIDAGFSSVMLDASAKPYAENVELCAKAAELAHAAGISVEAELGHVGGEAEGTTAEGAAAFLTEPSQAKSYVEATRIDCLAVAIGTVHGEYRGTPHLRLDRLEEIAGTVSQPLVLHGGSGTPPDQLKAAIRLGIAKINICTDIDKAYLAGIEAARGKLTPSVPGKFYVPAWENLKNEVIRHIRLFS